MIQLNFALFTGCGGHGQRGPEGRAAERDSRTGDRDGGCHHEGRCICTEVPTPTGPSQLGQGHDVIRRGSER